MKTGNVEILSEFKNTAKLQKHIIYQYSYVTSTSVPEEKNCTRIVEHHHIKTLKKQSHLETVIYMVATTAPKTELFR